VSESEIGTARVARVKAGWTLGFARVSGWGALAAFALSVVTAGAGAATTAGALFLAAVPLVALTLLARLVSGRAARRRREVEVDDEAVRFGAYDLSRAEIREGVVIPLTDKHGQAPARLVLRGRFGVLADATFEDVDDARAILRELRLDAASRPATFRFFFGLRVTVGADGVVIENPVPGLGRRQFVSHARINNVRRGGDRVILETSRARFEIMTNGGDAHAALVERLLAAKEAYAAGGGSDALALVRRRGRSALSWVKELRALGEGHRTDYRSASVPLDALYRAAIDPQEREEARIGATLALRGALDDEGRARLRVAAEAAASPRVRVALSAAADALDDEELARALDEEAGVRASSR
jgi:hypothetical protein